jgi:hypothetical protein
MGATRVVRSLVKLGIQLRLVSLLDWVHILTQDEQTASFYRCQNSHLG